MGAGRHDDQDPAGTRSAGRGVLAALAAWVQEVRDEEQLAVRYIQCDDCDGPTPHHTEVQIFSATSRNPTFVAAPPEVVCGLCCSLHPRVVGDEPPTDIEVTCGAQRPPRWPLSLLPAHGRVPGRYLPRALSGSCRHRFSVPGTARVVLCPRCITLQVGPAALPIR